MINDTNFCLINNGKGLPVVKTTTISPNIDPETTTFIIQTTTNGDLVTTTTIPSTSTTTITTPDSTTTDVSTTTTTNVPTTTTSINVPTTTTIITTTTTTTTTTIAPTSTTTTEPPTPCSTAPLMITPAEDQNTATPIKSPGYYDNGTYKITITCDASTEPNSMIFMQFNVDQGGPDDNFLPKVEAILECDVINNGWIYISLTGVSRPISEVNCLKV